MRRLSNVSLFAGCGGIDLGFKWAGFDTIAAVELTEYACDTLRKNFPETIVFGPPFSSGDVRMVTGDMIRKATAEYGEIDVLSGGPPCQPFSVAAGQRFGKEDPRYKRLGNLNKEKGDLLPEYVRLVLELRPKVFFLENVAGMMKWNDGLYLQESLAPLEHEYTFSTPTVVQAADYGVPQYRERMFIIGTRLPNIKPVLPLGTHFDGGLFNKHNTVQDALADFDENLPNHVLRRHSPSTIERYQKLKFGERDKLGRVDRLDPARPSKTIISGGDKGGGRSHLHPFLPRTLSPRESARLQTFPDDFVITGTPARQFTQVGNAVPPLLAYRFARYIIEEILGEVDHCCIELSAIKHPVVKQLSQQSLQTIGK